MVASVGSLLESGPGVIQPPYFLKRNPDRHPRGGKASRAIIAARAASKFLS
jgi:hypothetical protein